ncbi:MAG TPA: hypothetical protein VGC39_07085 [Candidatus Methylacidiphilales bacterium]
MKKYPKSSQFGLALGAAIASIAFFAGNAAADTSTFTNASGDNDYSNSGNWDTSSVPDLSTGNTAVINNGANVTYGTNPANLPGDLIISNGGTLEVKSGSWTQVNEGSWIQLGGQGNGAASGNGAILIDGGTFNQGSAGSVPFNVSGTGNTFTITSGAANVNGSFVVPLGLTYTQSGGTVTVPGEFDFDAQNATISGGVLNANLITGVNSGDNGGTSTLTFSGGLINLGYIYGGNDAQTVNFTLDSTGVMSFSAESADDITAKILAGAIEYNGTIADPADFSLTSNGVDEVLSLIPSLQGAGPEAVPEPSSEVMLGAGFALLALLVRRRTKSTLLQ